MASTVNPDLVRERKQATFDPLLLTYVLYGGPQETRRRRYIHSLADEDPESKIAHLHGRLTREEFYRECVKKNIEFYRRLKELGLKKSSDLNYFSEVFFAGHVAPLFLHDAAFIPTIIGQGTEEQKSKWLPLAYNLQIIGTYAQTEIGHGSFVRGLETTATYDVATEEFVLNSPKLTSIKFWVGGLGKSSNVCVVAAQLLIKGDNHGVHFFIVPLRDFNTHKTLPGVTVGDIGMKFGFDGIDNGFLKLDNVRIPRDYMLMRHSQVLKDGTFVKPKDPRLVYGSMTNIRAKMMNPSAFALASGCTIAVRYSAVRKQGETTPGGTENQILDYQTQQYKILPALATAYAFWFCGRYLENYFHQVTKEIDSGILDNLSQLHAMSAGLKAFGTWNSTFMMETLRMSCGGHGYSNASALPTLYRYVSASCTYEGENTILLLQTARYLLKCLTKARQGTQLSGFVSYLNQPLEGSTCSVTNNVSLSSLISAYEHRAHRQIERAAENIQREMTEGKSLPEASNSSGVVLCKTALAHCHLLVLKIFVETVEKKNIDAEVRRVLMSLCELYALYGIHENLGEFIEDGYMTRQQVELVDTKLYELLADVRLNAVALVDAFDIPDVMLNSALGRFDGNVYQALLDYAKQSKLNETEVHDSYYNEIQPFKELMRKNVDPELLSKL